MTEDTNVPNGTPRLEAGADAYLAFWSGLTPRTLDRLDTVVDPYVHFKDPFNEVTGIEAFRAVLEHMFAKTENPTTTLLRWGWAEPDVLLARWRFSARVAVFGDWSLEGMSEIRLGPDGKVVDHVDHYDAGEQVYAKLPGLGPILGLIRRRMAARPPPSSIG
jgi:predicted ester cyclase